MKTSLVICQWYVASLLSPVRVATEKAIIHHYMDDVLVCAPTDDVLSHALDLTINALVVAGFKLQEDKVQRMPPWMYLGLEIGKRTIVPQKLEIKAKIKTLTDVHQLCGALNWGQERSYQFVYQTKDVYTAKIWCGRIAHVEMASTTDRKPLALPKDEEVTRQAMLQNRAAVDYLLLLHGHRCEEFEGLYCFNLSTKAEDVHKAIQSIRGMVEDIKKETGDWLSGMFGNWDISGDNGAMLIGKNDFYKQKHQRILRDQVSWQQQLINHIKQSIPLLRKVRVAPETQLLLPHMYSEFSGALRHDKVEEW
ncbi:hypothetical protein DUI87_03406 [Hirundo rustica rustica]|uniref:ribonuclease H n=1 Tax=Hirundo rustica rustica TaxID=333673 RepID=A0A3M0L480_HIRRU|nr:hypothetical protein DUI87_03406 [Hirundo rustica rustica]